MREVAESGESGVMSAGVGRRGQATVRAEPADDASDEVRAEARRLWAAPVDVSAAVLAAQHGDEDSFRVIYRAVQPGLLRYLRVLVGEDAEDVASEAWLHIARDLRSFQGDSDGFRGWAATIARHRALDHLRRQRRRPGPSVPIEQLTDRPGDDDTAGSALEVLSTDTALALIARLPRDQAEAVLLRVVMGLDAKAAGRVLGKRPGAVRTAAYRGLRRLATFLEHPDVPPRSGDGDMATPM
ncbi:MAG TPA: RNA polymerase sigma factor [Actinoallomurus sp.]|nr:RNA polymerase sigma factor [Actinoallomurus sp.]